MPPPTQTCDHQQSRSETDTPLVEDPGAEPTRRPPANAASGAAIDWEPRDAIALRAGQSGSALSREMAHVWKIPLEPDPIPKHLDFQLATLSPDERQRAGAYLSQQARADFIQGRFALRLILASYLGRPPAALQFRYSEEGKPSLRLLPDDPPLQFNISHSDRLMLLAIANEGCIGIDIEAERSLPDASELVRRFFGMGEILEFEALPPSKRSGAFWRGWTRKEAVLKARGSGLLTPLDSFDVTLAAELPKVLRFDMPGEDPASWSLRSFEPAAGYVAAIARRGQLGRIRFFNLFAPGAPS